MNRIARGILHGMASATIFWWGLFFSPIMSRFDNKTQWGEKEAQMRVLQILRWGESEKREGGRKEGNDRQTDRCTERCTDRSTVKRTAKTDRHGSWHHVIENGHKGIIIGITRKRSESGGDHWAGRGKKSFPPPDK